MADGKARGQQHSWKILPVGCIEDERQAGGRVSRRMVQELLMPL